MPRTSQPSFPFSGTAQLGETEFERMRREAQAVASPPREAGISSLLPRIEADTSDLVVASQGGTAGEGDVRFCQSTEDQAHGVIMQTRGGDGRWATVWTLPVQSRESAAGMMGWLTDQAWRWPHFARMLERRGGEELSAWIFELMMQPGIALATPPRHEPSAYSRMVPYSGSSRDSMCPCRAYTYSGSRLSRGSYR